MKAIVDEGLCIGCGLCAQTCPEVFEMEGDKAKVIGSVVPQAVESSCKEATDNCPVTAIIIKG